MPEQFIEIEVERREVLGKNARRDAAAKGMIPGIVYGGGKEPVPIVVDPRKIIQILRSEKGVNSILLFSMKGTKAQRHVMIKDFQIEPVTNTLIHADFTRIYLDHKVHVKVPIVFEGAAWGVKNQGGVVDVTLREVEVECLPADIPDRIHVDLTPLKVNDHIRISDLKVAENVRIASDDPSLTVVHLAPPRVEAEPTPAEGEEAASQEPEVIGRGKKAEEGEGEAEKPAKEGKESKGKKE